jgi:hypothetical protein
MFLVAGEPGIGKSELADRLAAEATARGAEVLWGRNQGREIHATDLAAGGECEARAGAELEEATRWGDAGHAARVREEIEFLKDELSSAFGLGGRARRAGSGAERARKAVASRMQDTIAKIRVEHPVLALHLENAIRTGVFCSYRPDRSPGWNL